MSKYITVNPKVMCGKPCFSGTRIPVYIVLELLANGAKVEDILRDYPDLTKQHIRAALKYATELAREEVGAL